MSRRFFPCHAPGQAVMAPSRTLSAGSCTSEDSLTVCAVPRPWHCGQAPIAVLGEKESDSRRPGASAGYVPAREKSIRIELDRVVSVPTDEREPGVPRRCCSATAGGSPVISSTWGVCPCWISRRAYGATDSKKRRWASAKRGPKARDDVPEPETAVEARMASRGTSTSTFRRLFSRAPRTRTNPSAEGFNPAGSRVGLGCCTRSTLVSQAVRLPALHPDRHDEEHECDRLQRGDDDHEEANLVVEGAGQGPAGQGGDSFDGGERAVGGAPPPGGHQVGHQRLDRRILDADRQSPEQHADQDGTDLVGQGQPGDQGDHHRKHEQHGGALLVVHVAALSALVSGYAYDNRGAAVRLL